jgi:hypothetical protein
MARYPVFGHTIITDDAANCEKSWSKRHPGELAATSGVQLPAEMLAQVNGKLQCWMLSSLLAAEPWLARIR